MITIIGAGIAGLTCAKYLKERNIEALVLEASDAVGGRVRTDEVDGFRLDRGFQVFLTAYPEAKKILDYEKLELVNLPSGARDQVGRRFFGAAESFEKSAQSSAGAFFARRQFN